MLDDHSVDRAPDELLNRLEDTFKEASAKLRGDAGKRPEPAAVS
jgi:hypothetical protein